MTSASLTIRQGHARISPHGLLVQNPPSSWPLMVGSRPEAGRPYPGDRKEAWWICYEPEHAPQEEPYMSLKKKKKSRSPGRGKRVRGKPRAQALKGSGIKGGSQPVKRCQHEKLWKESRFGGNTRYSSFHLLICLFNDLLCAKHCKDSRTQDEDAFLEFIVV